MSRHVLDHVAFAVHRGADATPFLVGELGGRPAGSGPGGAFRFWQWTYEGGGKVEVLEPEGPPGGFLHRFLDARGPGVHHVTFLVPDLRAAADRAASLGYEVVGYNDTYPGWKEAFLHPKQAQGIVVQLAESEPALDPSYDEKTWSFPEAPEAAAPARIVALHLAATSLERARRQWGELLEGEAEEKDGRLWFRWPGSPLAIAVEVDAGPEGPRAVEFCAAQSVPLPEGPHPVFGTVFAQAESSG